jgi:predicted permease
VSGNFFTALGISPALGRTIAPADDLESAEPVVVISHPYWQRRFRSDAGVLGKTLTINNTVFTVAGVAPPYLVDMTKRGSVNAPDILIPLALEPRVWAKESWMHYPQNWWLTIIGRLKPGVTASQVQSSFNDVFERTARDGWNTFVASMPPEARANPSLGGRQVRVPKLKIVSASRGVSDSNAKIFSELAILSGIFATVLLIVCVNLANLSLSRATARQKEMAVRLAIGASRRRVVRQLLTESVVVAGIGGALGLLFAIWCTRLLSNIVFRIDSFSPHSYQIPKINLAVFLFSGLLTLVTGLLFGIVPALRTSKVDCVPAMREGENRFSHARGRLGKSLLVAQVALSLVLLIGAGLLLRTLWNLRQVDVGFNPNNLVVFTLQPGLSGYDRSRTPALYEQIEQRLLRVPGVRSVTFAAPEGLLAFGETRFDLWTNGQGPEPVHFVASVMSAVPNFFDTMEIPLKSGRGFTAADTQTSAPVAIVSETLAKTLSPDGHAVGRYYASAPQAPRRVEVIGVVADAKVNSLRDSPSPLVYRPIAQMGFPSRTVVVRGTGEAKALLAAIGDAVHQVDAHLPIGQLSTEMDRIEGSYLLNERIFAFASTFFGALALVIAMIGMFGLMSYTVARRTREIGIRMALGAEREMVLRSVMKEALLLVAIGVVIGLAGALALTRFIASLLFGLAPHDPLTISVSILLMLLVAVLAGYLPARRASRVDPMVALRYE